MIVLKSAAELETMHQANLLVHETLRLVAEAARPGTSTHELDALAEDHIRSVGARPAFKGYRGYPAYVVHVGERRDRPRHPVPNPEAQGR